MPCKWDENLLECCFADRVVCNFTEANLGILHGGEQMGPGGVRVSHMEVNIVLETEYVAIKLVEETSLMDAKQ